MNKIFSRLIICIAFVIGILLGYTAMNGNAAQYTVLREAK